MIDTAWTAKWTLLVDGGSEMEQTHSTRMYSPESNVLYCGSGDQIGGYALRIYVLDEMSINCPGNVQYMIEYIHNVQNIAIVQSGTSWNAPAESPSSQAPIPSIPRQHYTKTVDGYIPSVQPRHHHDQTTPPRTPHTHRCAHHSPS